MGNIEDPDLRKLRLLLAVNEHGSFTTAATHMDMAQPALSRIVRKLEMSFGVQMFRRNGRGVLPTEAGLEVLGHVRRIIDEVDSFHAAMGNRNGAPSGTVLLGIPNSVSMILIEPLFDRLRRSYPEIRLHVTEAFSGDLTEWVSSGRLDAAVIYDPGDNTKLVCKHLLVEDMFLCSAGGKAGKAPVIAMEKALDRPLVLPSRPHGLRLLVDRATQAAGFRPNVVLEFNSTDLIKRLVVKGTVDTILPYSIVHHEVRSGEILARRIVEPSITRSLVVAETMRRARTPATDAVVQCLIEEAQKLVAEGKWLGPPQ